MIKQIENEELKKWIMEEMEENPRPFRYEKTEAWEGVIVQGIGDYDRRLFYDFAKKEFFINHIHRDTGELINFSDFDEKTRADLSYYLNRDYEFVTMDDRKNPKFILMYSCRYDDFMELEHDLTFNRLESTCYGREKVEEMSGLFAKLDQLKAQAGE